MSNYKSFTAIFAINLIFAIGISAIAYAVLHILVLNKFIYINETYDTKTTYGVFDEYNIFTQLTTWTYYVDDILYKCTFMTNTNNNNNCWTTITYNVNDNSCVEEFGLKTHTIKKSAASWFKFAAIIYCCSVFILVFISSVVYYWIDAYKAQIHIAENVQQQNVPIDINDLIL